MDNKKKITFLIICIFLCITIIAGVIIVINLFPKIFFSIEEAPAISINGGTDGPTTIYIAIKYNWKIIPIILLLLLIIDFILFAIINVIEQIKKKNIKLIYKILIMFLINLLLSILLFSGMFIWSILISAVTIILIIVTGKIIKNILYFV
jgi:Na+-transporting methylmalonyl-CoA/oxaloacetate decarboxylase beta subunit